jgi:hypothetical protein
MLLVTEPKSSAAGSSLAERRRGFRIRQNRPVKVYEPNVAKYFPGQTRDISSTGLRLELPLSVPAQVGDVLNVHVGLSSAGESLANRRQMIPARIVWLDRSGPNARTRMVAGVEFLASIAAQVDAA